MTTPRTPFVSIEEVKRDTGLTTRNITFDVRNGYLPGEFDHRGMLRIRRNEWDAYLNGEWQPAAPGSHRQATGHRKPIGIHSVNRAS